MKSKQFRLCFGLLTFTLLCALPHSARAADGDALPNPVLETPKVDPEPQMPLQDTTQNNSVTTTPDQDLPPPSSGLVGDDQRLIVNRPEKSDDVFLPAPAAQDNVVYTPMGNPVVPNSVYDTGYERSRPTTRPSFSIYAGISNRSYPTQAIAGVKNGIEVGASYRMFGFGNVLFLSAFLSTSYIHVGDVGQFQSVRDWTLHYGPVLEFDLSRRFTFFGSFLRRSATLSAPATFDNKGVLVNNNPVQLANIGEQSTFELGGGAQYDFYVTPHGSIGVRGYIEKNYGSLTLTMALEPDPSKKLSIQHTEF